MQETGVQSLGREDSLEEGMATYSNILAWKVPWTEESGGLQSVGSQSDTTEQLSMDTLVVQWLRLPLPTKRVRIRSRVREQKSQHP